MLIIIVYLRRSWCSMSKVLPWSPLNISWFVEPPEKYYLASIWIWWLKFTTGEYCGTLIPRIQHTNRKHRSGWSHIWPDSLISTKVKPRSECAVPRAPTPSTRKLSLWIGVWNPCLPFQVMLQDAEAITPNGDAGSIGVLTFATQSSSW